MGQSKSSTCLGWIENPQAPQLFNMCNINTTWHLTEEQELKHCWIIEEEEI
uniref:Uncharacterized protein n=1 Tax=Arion vulgaris TaxID=1028688 RepID=A0A0B7ALK2_9EUPU